MTFIMKSKYHKLNMCHLEDGLTSSELAVVMGNRKRPELQKAKHAALPGSSFTSSFTNDVLRRVL
jgi:hypothetical protein